FGLHIGGAWRAPAEEMADHNPARVDEVVAWCAQAVAQDVRDAFDAAADAAATWRRLGAWDRAEILHRAAAILMAHADEWGRELALEEGKTFAEARSEV